GSLQARDPAVHAGRRDRRRHAGPGPGTWRDHGGDVRDRQRPQGVGLDPRAGHHHLRDHRQRIHRSGRRSLHLVAHRARPDPVRHHLHRAGDRALHVAAAAAAGGLTMAHGLNNALYIRRRARNTLARTLALAATAFGLGWLVLILGTLIFEGIG